MIIKLFDTEFDQEVVDDFNFLVQADLIDIKNHKIYPDKIKHIIDNSDCDKFVFRMNDEIPNMDSHHFLNLINLLDTYTDKQFKISLGTTTRFPYSINPFINFYVFHQIMMPIDCIQRQDIEYTHHDGTLVQRFDSEKYKINKKVDLSKKQVKGILSMRKSSWYRDILNEKISNFDGIYRYISYTQKIHESDILTKQYNQKFPSWEKLLNEYDSSLVSFIMETEHNVNKKHFQITPLTEKTPLAFMNFCIPIIFGEPNCIKELEDLGFWIANKDFGFGNSDFFGKYENKLDNFIKCINRFNNMKIKELKIYYNNNIEKIQNNYRLCSSIIQNETIQTYWPQMKFQLYGDEYRENKDYVKRLVSFK